MIFINDIGVMLDENVRRAAAHAIDKKTIVERLLSGYGVPIDTLLTPDYDGYDPSITVEYNPDLSKGFWRPLAIRRIIQRASKSKQPADIS